MSEDSFTYTVEVLTTKEVTFNKGDNLFTHNGYYIFKLMEVGEGYTWVNIESPTAYISKYPHHPTWLNAIKAITDPSKIFKGEVSVERLEP